MKCKLKSNLTLHQFVKVQKGIRGMPLLFL